MRKLIYLRKVAQLADNNYDQLSQPAAKVVYYINIAAMRNKSHNSSLTKYKKL